ncbi:hypothetical protein DN752_04120 [Echinicola strongylocentroti]|uniref:Uncharacterized protein n=1 Tax=Echinicola strongylocentroti TaxID=1795355 RepID=A0A2Z4IEV6_9BACT|nr:hypothetical protein DN752_04120 [Echinicola strongylocentroti]
MPLAKDITPFQDFFMLLFFSNLRKKSTQIIIICVISVPSVPQLFRLILKNDVRGRIKKGLSN